MEDKNEYEVTEEQVNAFKSFALLAAPVDFAIFGPGKSLGMLKETPLEGMLKKMEGKLIKKREEEKVEKIAIPLRLRSEKTRERAKLFGMWGGF